MLAFSILHNGPAPVLTLVLCIAVASWDATLTRTAAADVQLHAETFAALHKLIKPQPGESRWMDVPWLTDLHEARRKAAAEGKPLFLVASGKAISIGMC